MCKVRICEYMHIYLQSFTKYLRLALVLMQNNALPEKFSFCFLEFFPIINKIFILAERLSTGLLFYEVLRFS